MMPKLPNWPGATVAIIGAAPAHLDDLRQYKSIAVNRAVALAPWADVLVSLDGNYPPSAFKGLCLVGNAQAAGQYLPMPYEVVCLGPSHVIHIRQNTLAAMRVAAMCGAAKIVLAGINAARYEQLHNYRGLTEGLAALTQELAEQGIAVEQHHG